MYCPEAAVSSKINLIIFMYICDMHILRIYAKMWLGFLFNIYSINDL